MHQVRNVTISNGTGESLSVALAWDGGTEAAVVFVEGVRYHLERLTADDLARRYRVDLDPDYRPRADTSGGCYMIAPFSD